MNYPKYYTDGYEIMWRADVGGVEIGMNDSPFESSECSEDMLKLTPTVKEITYDEAKSLFPNLIK